MNTDESPGSSKPREDELPRWLLSKEEVLRRRDEYERYEDSFNKGVEESLRIKFQQSGHATHEDLNVLLQWKFAEMPGRLKRSMNLLAEVAPETVQIATEAAFSTADDRTRLRLLLGSKGGIKGVGAAVASVILTFQDPLNFAIIDIHSWRELFGKEDKSFFDEDEFIRFLVAVRRVSIMHGLPCRDVEKALFRKNRVDSH